MTNKHHFPTLLSLLLLVVSPASGEPFNGQLVVYVADAEVMEASSEPEHVLLLAKLKGLAILDSGEVGTITGVEVADNKKETGEFYGYVTILFDDKSSNSFRFEGHQNNATQQYQAQLRFTTGTGRFSGISGGGKLQGRNYEAIDGSHAVFTANFDR